MEYTPQKNPPKRYARLYELYRSIQKQYEKFDMDKFWETVKFQIKKQEREEVFMELKTSKNIRIEQLFQMAQKYNVKMKVVWKGNIRGWDIWFEDVIFKMIKTHRGLDMIKNHLNKKIKEKKKWEELGGKKW